MAPFDEDFYFLTPDEGLQVNDVDLSKKRI